MFLQHFPSASSKDSELQLSKDMSNPTMCCQWEVYGSVCPQGTHSNLEDVTADSKYNLQRIGTNFCVKTGKYYLSWGRGFHVSFHGTSDI